MRKNISLSMILVCLVCWVYGSNIKQEIQLLDLGDQATPIGLTSSATLAQHPLLQEELDVENNNEYQDMPGSEDNNQLLSKQGYERLVPNNTSNHYINLQQNRPLDPNHDNYHLQQGIQNHNMGRLGAVNEVQEEIGGYLPPEVL